MEIHSLSNQASNSVIRDGTKTKCSVVFSADFGWRKTKKQNKKSGFANSVHTHGAIFTFFALPALTLHADTDLRFRLTKERRSDSHLSGCDQPRLRPPQVSTWRLGRRTQLHSLHVQPGPSHQPHWRRTPSPPPWPPRAAAAICRCPPTAHRPPLLHHYLITGDTRLISRDEQQQVGRTEAGRVHTASKYRGRKRGPPGAGEAGWRHGWASNAGSIELLARKPGRGSSLLYIMSVSVYSVPPRYRNLIFL